MKIRICKCKGRKKANKKWHDCRMLFVQPFEKSCPMGCERQYHVIREFDSEMPYSEVEDKV